MSLTDYTDEEQLLARLMYRAYGEKAGWKAYNDEPMKRWGDLTTTEVGLGVQEKWCESARTALQFKPSEYEDENSAIKAASVPGVAAGYNPALMQFVGMEVAMAWAAANHKYHRQQIRRWWPELAAVLDRAAKVKAGHER